MASEAWLRLQNRKLQRRVARLEKRVAELEEREDQLSPKLAREIERRVYVNRVHVELNPSRVRSRL